MGLYEIAKVVHFLGLIAIVGFFIIYSRAGPRLRKATDMAEVRIWLGLLDTARPMIPGGGVLLILSGFTMAALRWRGPYPFIAVGLITLLAAWITAAIVGGRHLRSMRAAATATSGPVPAELSRLILNPRPWSILFGVNLAILGVLFVMTTKIGWISSIAVVVVLGILGAFIGARLARADGIQIRNQ